MLLPIPCQRCRAEDTGMVLYRSFLVWSFDYRLCSPTLGCFTFAYRNTEKSSLCNITGYRDEQNARRKKHHTHTHILVPWTMQWRRNGSIPWDGAHRNTLLSRCCLSYGWRWSRKKNHIPSPTHNTHKAPLPLPTTGAYQIRGQDARARDSHPDIGRFCFNSSGFFRLAGKEKMRRELWWQRRSQGKWKHDGGG